MSSLTYCGRPPLSTTATCQEFNIFVYPSNKKLKHKQWDTYSPPTSICNNCVESIFQTSNIGIVRYRCCGHTTNVFHS